DDQKQPDAWATFNARSLLGAALLGQKQYADSEPLLLDGYEGMKQREAKIPPQGKVCLTEAVERLVALYDATGPKEKADEWRKQLEAAEKKPKPERSVSQMTLGLLVPGPTGSWCACGTVFQTVRPHTDGLKNRPTERRPGTAHRCLFGDS